MRIPLMIIPLGTAEKLTYNFRGLFGRLLVIYPGLKYDLVQADMRISAESYLASTFLSAFLWAFFMFGSIFSVKFFVSGAGLSAAANAASPGAGLGLLLYIYYIFYPKVYAGKVAQSVDKDLVFALKDLLLQVSVGIPLYNAMVNISRADYGVVSDEFAHTVREVRVGVPMEIALQRMAIRSNSEFLKKSVWQLMNGWKAGASLKGVLQSLVNELTINKRYLIKSYGQELNMWVLVYMLFAVVAPTIGTTLLVVLSAMTGSAVTSFTFAMLIGSSVMVQIILIGFVKSRRPVVAV